MDTVLCFFMSSLRTQSMESFKRKAMESSQTAADLKLHLEKYHSQLKEAQTAVADKTTALDQQSFKYRRIAVSLLASSKLAVNQQHHKHRFCINYFSHHLIFQPVFSIKFDLNFCALHTLTNRSAKCSGII